MDKYLKILVVIAVVSPWAAGRSYGGSGYGGGGYGGRGSGYDGSDIHTNFHRYFEPDGSQYWQAVLNRQHHMESPHEDWHSPANNFHRMQYHHSPRGYHSDRAYWRDFHHGNWHHGHDWAYPTEHYHDTFDKEVQTPQWWSPTRTTTKAPPLPAAPSPQLVLACMRTCPTTPEYNPVCGSNNITYSNPGRLECARYCGVDVTLQRQRACSVQPPTPTPAVTWPPIVPTQAPTLAPITPPQVTSTELTSSATEIVTISPDILNSIFTKPPDGTNTNTNVETDPNSDTNTDTDIDGDIDIRTRSKLRRILTF